MPLDGGAPVQLAGITPTSGAISPDGKLVASFDLAERGANSKSIVIIPFEGGEAIKNISVPQNVNQDMLRWTADGLGVTYIDTRDGVSNIWVQPLDGSPSHQLTHFTSDQIYYFDWSRDGKLLACARGEPTSDIIMMSNLR